MEKRVYKQLKETVYYEKLDNGLDVILVPKNDYNKTFAVFSTNYGGLDNRFVPYNSNEFKEYPKGIAHFLEHKLFEMEDGVDASTYLSKLGANSNAFTSYNQTSFLFSATSNVNECVMYLLDFVQSPYFTDENVKKEQGIIAQEIMMYQDFPDFKSQMGVLKNLYKDNFIREDIVGSVEEISKITKEMLYECYYTFYNPKNMQLFIIGNFDLSIIDDIKENQSKKEFKEYKQIKRDYPTDQFSLLKKEETISMDTYMAKLTLGLRFKEIEGNYALNDIDFSILLSILFGDSSKFKNELLDKKIINDSFGFYSDFSKCANYMIIASDTSDVDELEIELNKYIKSLKDYKISDEEFIRTRNAYIGRMINLLNSLEGTATNYATYSFAGINLYEIIEYIQKITKEKLEKYLNLFSDCLISKFVILPNQDYSEEN